MNGRTRDPLTPRIGKNGKEGSVTNPQGTKMKGIGPELFSFKKNKEIR
jgi:hypothetical protein